MSNRDDEASRSRVTFQTETINGDDIKKFAKKKEEKVDLIQPNFFVGTLICHAYPQKIWVGSGQPLLVKSDPKVSSRFIVSLAVHHYSWYLFISSSFNQVSVSKIISQSCIYTNSLIKSLNLQSCTSINKELSVSENKDLIFVYPIFNL